MTVDFVSGKALAAGFAGELSAARSLSEYRCSCERLAAHDPGVSGQTPRSALRLTVPEIFLSVCNADLQEACRTTPPHSN